MNKQLKWSIVVASGLFATFFLGNVVRAADSIAAEPELTIDVSGERRLDLPKSSPIYTIDRQQIDRQDAKNVADVLKNLPGFTINDVGYGSDIHTGTYYRGASTNQFIILLNGRPINTNVNTYHGATDLNSIPVDAIDRIELSSGASNIIYGSEAFGGVVNIITKAYKGTSETNVSAELGSYGRQDYRASYIGGDRKLNYRIGVEKYRIDNNYSVPIGAANRDPVTGKLTNSDTDTLSYSGNISTELNDRNRLDFDVTKITSRRGLVYFGFPFQRDRLNHDTLNLGLNWRSQLSPDQSSILNTTISYNQDYFNTFGPSGTNSRTGTRRAFYNNPGQISTDFIPSFLNLDLGARIPIGENVGLNLFVENLADVQYEKVNRIYSPGRTYRVGVSANF